MSNSFKVYYDVRMLGFSGIGTHIEENLKILTKKKSLDLFLMGNLHTIRKHFPDYEKNISYTAPIYSLQEQIFFPKLKDGIYHIPHYNAPIFMLDRSLVVIHDLIHLDSEEFHKPHYRLYAKLLLGQITKKARAIITVSNYTKNRLLEEFPKTKSKVITIYNGINREEFYPAKKFEIQTFKNKYQLPKNFFLVVGIGKKHKNLDTLLISLKDLWKSKKVRYPLVIAGTNAKIPDYAKAYLTEEIKDKVIVLPYLEKKEMRILYSSSFCCIVPSKLEGFGFPLLEAMACGVPTISSYAASLPEIGGDATIYFDPYSPKEIQNAILKICENKSLRESAIQKGIERVKQFSWNTSANKIINIYKEIL